MGERTHVMDPAAGPAAGPAPDPRARTEVAPLEGAPSVQPRMGSLTGSEDAPTLVANRYEILGMLGSGGMGTVYRARDRELEEIVALKVLKKELASASGMLERFRREVKLARRVTHRNVARTFDIGEHEGDRFLTMELIAGEMLGSHLQRRGTVPVRHVVAIARDVCAGLAAAHAADVIHRDLKPENVILALDGRAVITDFGIARALAQADAHRTAAGMIGTPSYMAPEQVEGATDLDARADLYALGTMLFELLTGQPAWPGDTVIAIAAARILRPPPDIRSINPALPADIAELVLKLMARHREDRFASAEEAGNALAALPHAESPSTTSLVPTPSTATPVRARGQRKTVAVLPLSSLGAEDDEYLTQTLTEDLVDLLSVVPELRVRPRGETARFDARARGRSADAREAGRELDVDVVVEGSLRRVADRVRISIRVITVKDGFQLWARRFDRMPGEVLSVADEAASAIALALAAERAPEARQPATGDAAAQELYIRGRYLLHRGWIAVSQEGMGLLRQAHERAPDDTRIAGSYALAMARVRSIGETGDDAAAAARLLAEKTLEADPSQPEARVALALIHLSESEIAAACMQLQRALAVAPNCIEALDTVGRLLIEAGRPESGIRTLRKVLAIDPTINQARHGLARVHALLGDIDLADEVLGPVPEHPHDFAPYMMLKARFAMWRSDADAAREIQRIVRESALATSPMIKLAVMGITSVTISREISKELIPQVSSALPLDAHLPPRRLAFHAQLRAEVKITGRDVDGALADLRVGDTNGLLDLLWLDRCALFDEVRHRPELAEIRASTAARAERVARVLDP